MPAPGFRFTEQDQPVMTPREVMRLARKWGLPPKGIMQIAKGESGLKPRVQQHDPGDGMVGYGLLQMTPNAWGKDSPAYRYMQKLGGIEAMSDPDKNMQMARFLYKSAGNSFAPWYGTRFLTDRSGEGTLKPVRPNLQVGGGGGRGDVVGTTPKHLAFDPGEVGQALQTLTQPPERPPVTLPTAPAFAARAPLPQGYTPPAVQTAPVSEKPDLQQVLSQLSALEPTGGGQATLGGETVRGGGGGGVGRGGGGAVEVLPGANRPGVGLTPLVKGALSHLADVSGHTIRVGTGTNHSQMTTTGNVSDHWSGNGADIPLSGGALTRRGRQALVAYGMPRAQAAKAEGGIYNLNWRGHRVQVIFDTTEGGNHWDHLHVGIR